jgi:hypothetical protein
MSLRPSFARTLCWILAACLAAWAVLGDAGSVRRVPRAHEASRVARGASTVAGECRRDDLLGWLSADFGAARVLPHPDLVGSATITPVVARALPPLARLTSPDRATVRCRST